MTTELPPTSPAANIDISPSPQSDHTMPIGRPLRAVIRKELHQNLALAALVIVIDVIFILTMEWSASGDSMDRNILLLGSVTGATTVGCALAALCIGLFQPFFDRNFDLWAFLVHRPVPRSTLFAGRAIAGLILYCTIAGIPLLIVILLAMSPYGQGMFLWPYTLPSLADFAAGIPFYFAGLLAADRRAPLYGSRFIPIAAAIGAAVFAYWTPWFFAAICVSLASAAILALAAEGSVISHGYTLNSPLRGRLATLATLLVSFTVILLPVALSGRQSALAMHWRSFSQPMPIPVSYASTSRVLSADGTLDVQTERYERKPAGWRPEEFELKSKSYTDLQGHPIPDPKLAEDLKTAKRFSFGFYPYSDRPLPTFRDIQDLAVLTSTEGSAPDYAGRWYWVPSHRLFYIYKLMRNREGYIVGHPEFVGTLGISGFAKPGSHVEPFPDDIVYRWPLIYTSKALFRIDPPRLNLETLFTAPSGETLMAASPERDSNPISDYASNLFVITDRHVSHITATGQLLHQLPITHDLRKETINGRYFPEQHLWVLEYSITPVWIPQMLLEPSIPANTAFRDRPNTWETYNDTGTLLSSHSFPTMFEITPPITYTPPAIRSTKLHQSDRAGGFFLALSGPLLVLANEGIHLPMASYLNPYNEIVPVLYFLHTPQGQIAFFATLLLCALITFLLTNAYRLALRWPWILVALLCGPATIPAFIAFNHWSRRIRCPNCHARRPLIEPTCPHCHAPWPHPTPTNTEIFT